jgi:hypothetical protein
MVSSLTKRQKGSTVEVGAENSATWQLWQKQIAGIQKLSPDCAVFQSYLTADHPVTI